MGKNNSSDDWRFGGDNDLPIILLLYFWLNFDRVDFDEDRDDIRDDHRDNGRNDRHHNGRNNGRDDDPDMDDIREAVIRVLRKRIQHML